MRICLTSLLLFFSSILLAEPVYLETIPLQCNEVEPHLTNIQTPQGFNISPLNAHKLAMAASGIIKPCASKLEQVIYIDSTYYYFTNSVLVHPKIRFPTKAVKVNGITGEAINGFNNT